MELLCKQKTMKYGHIIENSSKYKKHLLHKETFFDKDTCPICSGSTASINRSAILFYYNYSALLGVSGYCIIGSLIMYFGRGARGKEVIPNIQFWTSTVGLVKVSMCL